MAARVTESTVRVEGLIKLQRALKRVEADLPKRLRLANLAAAEVVAAEARRRVGREAKHPTGRLQSSVKARAEQRGASVQMGGKRVPYAGFFDFGNKVFQGNKVGRGDTVDRPFITEGRIIYPSLADKNDEAVDKYADEIDDLLRDAGLR